MKQLVTDYIKSCVANKGTLTGYILLGTATTAKITELVLDSFGIQTGIPLDKIALTSVSLGPILLAGTYFGRETLKAYRRTKENIHKFGRIDRRFANKYLGREYCISVGARLAMKESDVEYKLIRDGGALHVP